MLSSKNTSRESDMSGNFNKISQGTEITGTVNASTDFRMDGHLDGNINCKGKIVVGDKAVIKGDINTKNIDVHGKVIGSITVSEVLCLKSTSIIEGKLFARKFVVELGAQFNGTCQMSEKIPEVAFDSNGKTKKNEPILINAD
ncbi:MAG: polymer-forming cytoskeletal protein [Prevotellaceae bacterium]|jgi:cytoskeletal protein CcmA (bactofilin family)|nr:polymer-forming cytoskeletal protein [Prevotellaceae bacterium]